MSFPIVLMVVVVGGWMALKKWRSFHLSQEVGQRVINRFGERCKKCDQVYYTCSMCGCQFEDELDCRRCYEWDCIIKQPHEHKHLHDHEEEET